VDPRYLALREFQSALGELQPEEFEFSSEPAPSLLREVGRSRPDYVRWVQGSLNRLLGLRLAVDGILGPATRSAIRSFQKQQGLRLTELLDPGPSARSLHWLVVHQLMEQEYRLSQPPDLA
jgi:hypothetical protein